MTEPEGMLILTRTLFAHRRSVIHHRRLLAFAVAAATGSINRIEPSAEVT